MIEIIKRLSCCNLCPRYCGINRNSGEMGYCRVGSNPLVASVVIHQGEEPVLSGSKGICNVFFAHCNLSCSFCQNYQISSNNAFDSNWLNDYDLIVNKINAILDQGIKFLGFVSPTHQAYQMTEIINRVRRSGYNPRVVYNTNCYDNPLVIKELERFVDIYLPDFKYSNNIVANRYSGIKDYSIHAMNALKEMVWQKGTSPILDNDGLLISGVIVRHLVLPKNIDDSKRILADIANEISPNLTISLMSQYYPSSNEIFSKQPNRTLTKDEYNFVVEELAKLGYHRGWIQDLSSSSNYLPNFKEKNPFY